ncbi:MAG: T9SS type A sorting domain-containing protein, partial [Bacteroidota bacterium]|nr:T9SS type A sorting domain-containing protein [Bacteroidota bacterium]
TGSINSSTTSITLIPGETIYVRIWGDQPWYGPFDICAVLEQPPQNDDPCTAFALPLQHGCLMSTYTNTNATNTGTTAPGASMNGVPTPTCGLPVNDDVWFTVPVPPNGIVQLDLLAGTMNDAAMAAYRVTSGSCTTNDLVLQEINCAINGSQQGAGNSLMPYLNISGETSGTTLYIRVWRQTGTNGTFSICARRTDPPPGDCFYTLNMMDVAGDGWGGSFVTVCIGGNCSNYTVLGAVAAVNIGAYIGQTLTVSYTADGGFQSQNSFVLGHSGQPVYVSGPSPMTGMVYNTIVACNPPPAPTGDCIGAISLCSNNTIPCMPYQGSYYGSDLTPENAGCLMEEAQGHWFFLFVDPNIDPCTPMAFDIVGGNQVCGTSAAENVFDFAVWGPFPTVANQTDYCSMLEQPYRCNYASISPGVKGLAFDNDLPAHQYSGGGSMAKHLIVSSCDRFILFVNNRDSTGQQFQIHWKTPPPDFQVSTADCSTPAAPGSVAELGCWTDGGCVPISVAVPALNSSTVQISPNPADEVLRISELGSGVMNWEIFDGIGRRVLSGKGTYSSVLDIQIHSLDAGSYYLQIRGEEGTTITTHRFIKQ